MIGPDLEERIRRMVDGWPPVSTETYAQLALLLGPEHHHVSEPAASSQHLPRQAAA